MTKANGSAVRPARFDCDGFGLVGTIHVPDAGSPRSDLAVVMLNQGPLDRSGAHRISVHMARHWAAQGVPTLRFDARGVGESEGEWNEPDEGASIKAQYKLIEEGAWVADAHAAIDFVVRETGARRVVLAGLCGGGATAMQAAAHPHVYGVVTVGMPVRVQADISGVADMVDEKIRSETGRYVSKLLNPTAWRRFLTLQTDYSVLWAVLSQRVTRLFVKERALDPRLNAGLVRSFESAVAQRKQILFVYPEKDYLWLEFQELFESRFPRASARFELATIPQANHTFTEPSWQESLHTIVDAWTTQQIRTPVHA